MTHLPGTVVRLESGGWAQYRHVETHGPNPMTLLVAVELTEEEARKLLLPSLSPVVDVLH